MTWVVRKCDVGDDMNEKECEVQSVTWVVGKCDVGDDMNEGSGGDNKMSKSVRSAV